MDFISILPHIIAGLNLGSAILVSTAYYQIRNRNETLHKIYMVMALIFSSLFLICYITYHLHVGNVKFAGEGIVRPIYFSILIAHVLVATIVLPMILMTVTYAIKKQFEKHRRIARWTLPLWVFVSTTGFIVYLMAFHFYAPVMQ
jgi:putative membrane protein